MLKQILNVRGLQNLSKIAQQTINGGVRSLCPSEGGYCPNDAAMIPVNCITHVALCCSNNIWVSC